MPLVPPPLWIFFKHFAVIPEREWRECRHYFQFHKLAVGDYLVQPGDSLAPLTFVVQGLLGSFSVDQRGQQIIRHFAGPGDTCAPLSALLQKHPAEYYIEALIESEVYTISFRQFCHLYSRHQCWERLGRILMENSYLSQVKREDLLMQKSGLERWNLFNRENRHLVDRLPQYQLASYLGLTPQSLSRLKRRNGSTINHREEKEKNRP